jgi:hypothetical protein
VLTYRPMCLKRYNNVVEDIVDETVLDPTENIRTR